MTTATYESGFGSSSRLYERSSANLGMTPSAYGAAGAACYAIVSTPLGRLLVGTTTQGVCAVRFGESDAELETALRHECPAASLERCRRHLDDHVTTIARSVEGRTDLSELPLDVRPTAFQARVWAALREIPAGETRSYKEVAVALGQPTAARAVARACATNPVALAVPCHRVVRGDGRVGGYRWGAERKRRLLAGERPEAE